jgi:hypothetical protein
MSNPYYSKRWKTFRNEVIELDGGMCRQCKRRQEDGVVLQVHHLRYIPRNMPWDYPYSDCETLCQRCHAAAHGIIRPSIGWEYIGDEDLGDLDGKCEWCGTEIRYVFWLQHPNWEPLSVGTNCCDNLTGTKYASNHMESLRRFQARLTRFITSSRWTTSYGVSSIRQKSIAVDILALQLGFKIRMNGRLGKKSFVTLEEAKKATFELIENGTAEKYLKRYNNQK